MYEELISRLKELCYNCTLWDGYKCCLKGECIAQTRLEAADAIEELLKSEYYIKELPKDIQKEIDECFDHWCRQWAKDHKFDQEETRISETVPGANTL